MIKLQGESPFAFERGPVGAHRTQRGRSGHHTPCLAAGRFGAVPTASQTGMTYFIDESCQRASQGPFRSTEMLRYTRVGRAKDQDECQIARDHLRLH